MIDALNLLSGRWLELMWRVTWQGTIFIAVMFLVTRLCKRLSPTIKHVLWMLVIVKFLIMPFAVVPVTYYQELSVDSNPLSAERAVDGTAVPEEREKNEGLLSSERSVPPAALDAQPLSQLSGSPTALEFSSQLQPAEMVGSFSRAAGPRPARDWPLILFAVWLCGVMSLLTAVIFRSVQLQKRLSTSKLVVEGDRLLVLASEAAKAVGVRTPAIKLTGAFRSPLVCGLLRPTLVLPQHVTEEFNDAELRAIIRHELAHVKRLDVFTNWLQVAAQVFYFFNPLVWFANRQTRLEREQACDDWVLQLSGGERKTYADTLVKVVELCSGGRSLVPGFVGVSEPFTFVARRLRMIADTGRRISTRLSGKVLGALVILALICIPAYARRQAVRSTDGISVSGRVVDSSGNGIANARVHAYLRTYKVGKDRIVDEVACTGGGSFEFRDLVPPGEGHAHYVFIAEAPGFALGWERNRDGAAREAVEIILHPPGGVSGRVVDGKGSALADAMVKARSIVIGSSLLDSGRLYLQDVVDLVSDTTDEEGRFNIKNLPEGASVYLAVPHKGYYIKNRRASANVSVGTQGLEIVLRRGGIIRGQVTFQEKGEAAESIAVFCQGSPPGGGWGRTETDSHGRYALDGLSPGAYNVCVDFQNEQPEWTAAAREAVSVPDGGVVEDVDLLLIKGGSISGQVIDAQTREPLSGVRLGFYGPARPESGAAVQSAHTGEDGLYTFRGPPGRTRVYVFEVPHGYLYPGNQRKRYAEVRSGEVTGGVDFELEAGIAVSGTVVDEAGQGASGATVTGYPVDRTVRWRSASEQTDANGKFSIVGIPSGSAIEIQATREGSRSEKEGLSVGKKAITDVVLQLRPLALSSLSGRVVDEGGKPVPGARVHIRVMHPQGLGTWLNSPPVVGSTDDEGLFLFDKLDPQDRFSLASVKKAGYRLRSLVPIEKDSEGKLHVADLEMITLSRTLSGSVMDTSGVPAPGAIVFVVGQTIDSTHRANAQGRFDLKDLPEGEISVGAMRGEAEYGYATVLAGVENVTLQLETTQMRRPPAATPTDIELATQLIEEAWEFSADNAYYARSHLPAMLARVDVARAIEMAEGGSGERAKVILAYVAPELSVEKADRILKTVKNSVPPEKLSRALFEAASEWAESDRARAEAAFQEAMLLRAALQEKSGWQVASSYISMALAARSLDHHEWRDYTEEAFTEAQGIKDDWKRALCGRLGLLDSERAVRLAETIEESRVRQTARSRIVSQVASEDPEKALELYESLPQWEDRQGKHQRSMAGKALVRGMCVQNLEVALRIAKEIELPHHAAEAITAVADATQDTTQAQMLYDMAVSSARKSGGRSGPLARVIGAMKLRYPGKAMGIAEVELAQHSSSDSPVSRGLLELAYYIGDIAPNTARSIIENEVVHAVSGDGPEGSGLRRLQATAMAMVRLDAERAVEIARDLPLSFGRKSFNYRAEAFRKLAQYLLAEEAVRRDLHFGRWCASDTWTPGEPTKW